MIICALQADEWLPTSYSGTVTITDAAHVQFDLTFTDGTQSREVVALYLFERAMFDQAIGKSDL